MFWSSFFKHFMYLGKEIIYISIQKFYKMTFLLHFIYVCSCNLSELFKIKIINIICT